MLFQISGHPCQVVEQLLTHAEIKKLETSTFVNAKVTHQFGYIGYTALHLASENGHNDVVKVLLNHANGADVRVYNGARKTALTVAWENGRNEVVQTLMPPTQLVRIIVPGGAKRRLAIMADWRALRKIVRFYWKYNDFCSDGQRYM